MVLLRRALTVIDRTLIEVRRQDGWGVAQIAAALGRSSSVISGELALLSNFDGVERPLFLAFNNGGLR